MIRYLFLILLTLTVQSYQNTFDYGRWRPIFSRCVTCNNNMRQRNNGISALPEKQNEEIKIWEKNPLLFDDDILTHKFPRQVTEFVLGLQPPSAFSSLNVEDIIGLKPPAETNRHSSHQGAQHLFQNGIRQFFQDIRTREPKHFSHDKETLILSLPNSPSQWNRNRDSAKQSKFTFNTFKQLETTPPEHITLKFNLEDSIRINNPTTTTKAPLTVANLGGDKFTKFQKQHTTTTTTPTTTTKKHDLSVFQTISQIENPDAKKEDLSNFQIIPQIQNLNPGLSVANPNDLHPLILQNLISQSNGINPAALSLLSSLQPQVQFVTTTPAPPRPIIIIAPPNLADLNISAADGNFSLIAGPENLGIDLAKLGLSPDIFSGAGNLQNSVDLNQPFDFSNLQLTPALLPNQQQSPSNFDLNQPFDLSNLQLSSALFPNQGQSQSNFDPNQQFDLSNLLATLPSQRQSKSNSHFGQQLGLTNFQLPTNIPSQQNIQQNFDISQILQSLQQQQQQTSPQIRKQSDDSGSKTKTINLGELGDIVIPKGNEFFQTPDEINDLKHFITSQIPKEQIDGENKPKIEVVFLSDQNSLSDLDPSVNLETLRNEGLLQSIPELEKLGISPDQLQLEPIANPDKEKNEIDIQGILESSQSNIINIEELPPDILKSLTNIINEPGNAIIKEPTNEITERNIILLQKETSNDIKDENYNKLNTKSESVQGSQLKNQKNDNILTDLDTTLSKNNDSAQFFNIFKKEDRTNKINPEREKPIYQSTSIWNNNKQYVSSTLKPTTGKRVRFQSQRRNIYLRPNKYFQNRTSTRSQEQSNNWRNISNTKQIKNEIKLQNRSESKIKNIYKHNSNKRFAENYFEQTNELQTTEVTTINEYHDTTTVETETTTTNK